MIIILVDVNDFFVLRRNRIAEERRRPLCPALVVCNAGAHVRQNRVVASGIFQHFTCLCSVHLNAAVCPMFCIVVVALLLLRGVVQLLPQLESSDMNAELT